MLCFTDHKGSGFIVQEFYIETAEQLAELCGRLQGSPWLALDTEFIREKTYFPELCLIQIATRELAACIDPLRVTDLEPLRELLSDRRITKVFHAARQDMEILFQLWGDLPRPVFDTQLAATLAGMGDQIGYGAAVERLLGRELDKDQTRTDWSRRPLRDEQLRYALNDVVYLGEIYLKLVEQLARGGRLDWLAADFMRLCDPAAYAVEPAEQWRRVKGYQTLKGVRLAVLQDLAAWREIEAREANRPRRWIVKDEILFDLARILPADHARMQRIRGLDKGVLKRWGSHWLGIIRDARDRPEKDWPVAGDRAGRPSPQQEAAVDLLMAVVRLRGAELSISPGTLVGRQQLHRLVQGDRNLQILEGWRGEVVGQDLVAVLSGERWPRMRQGLPVLEGGSDGNAG